MQLWSGRTKFRGSKNQKKKKIRDFLSGTISGILIIIEGGNKVS